MATPSLAWPELVGYAASILVACSLMLSNTRQLRLVNLAGALTFTAYGALVGAWPVLAVNLFITAVNVYYLVQMARRPASACCATCGAMPGSPSTPAPVAST